MNFFSNLFTNGSSAPESKLIWVKNLSGMDDIHALKYATDQLNSDSKNDLFQDDQDVKSLLEVEKNTQLIADRISTLYMSTEHINAELEKQIENAMYLYYRQKFIIYNDW